MYLTMALKENNQAGMVCSTLFDLLQISHLNYNCNYLGTYKQIYTDFMYNIFYKVIVMLFIIKLFFESLKVVKKKNSSPKLCGCFNVLYKTSYVLFTCVLPLKLCSFSPFIMKSHAIRVSCNN